MAARDADLTGLYEGRSQRFQDSFRFISRNAETVK
jgi:hypothetical protein